ncbi:MAG: hypothetical protein DWQ05_03200 [Calditrichaeota bacterium]|nr:MAG: hypothetical protein DWQ05_03200 [Calditrichota bacterium]
MQMTPKKVSKWVLAAGFAVSMVLAGCGGGPNAEQLQLLEETKQAALSAEQKLQQCESGKASASDQLEQKKRDLQKAQDEMATVKSRLGM